jgi:subtilisin family serine protease
VRAAEVSLVASDGLAPDSSRWATSRWDSSRWDSSRWDSSRWDGTDFVPDPLLLYQWGLADMNVPDAWSLTTGSMGKTLCVVDTGVDATHPDLAAQMWTAPDGSHGWDFVNDDGDPMDDAGHGTHVAGVAAASVGNGIGTAGVVNARIMAVKVLDADGIGTEADLAAGIAWCADHGADVISMSLSTDQDSKAVRRAVERAQQNGALLVASAGNVGKCTDDCKVYPAAYEGVIGVAALDMTRQHASFSRSGPWVDLAAPGELIAGPFPGGLYALGTGTSQATALVSGVALLAWDHAPTLDAKDIETALRRTAQDLGTPGKDKDTGFGEPDAAALLLAVTK